MNDVIIPLEIDILPIPSNVCEEAEIYSDELSYIVKTGNLILELLLN